MNPSIEVKVPDIGDYTNVPIIDVLVKVGDAVEKEQSLITLESDKATMDVPSPAAGVVRAVLAKVGDVVSEGVPIIVLEADVASASAVPAAPVAPITQTQAQQQQPQQPQQPQGAQPAPVAQPASQVATVFTPVEPPAPVTPTVASSLLPAASPDENGVRHASHASPSVRMFARELGVDVGCVQGSGPKGRITRDDITAFVKSVMAGQTAPDASSGGGALNLLPWPKIDFAKFGPVDVKPLSRIRKISGANLHRNWVMIPHVTNHDEADITDLEALRVNLNREYEKAGVKFTMLAFAIRACVAALKAFPTFNASLDGESLVFKQYWHIGFAVDTLDGLVVPVLRDADKKGLVEIARELGELSKLARAGKLKPEQMQGGCFSISSLGSIGGTHFTPLINAPEVAILALARSTMKAVWDGKAFVPRLMLPLSLSYDHRVIDGAQASHFNAYLCAVLADFRRVVL